MQYTSHATPLPPPPPLPDSHEPKQVQQLGQGWLNYIAVPMKGIERHAQSSFSRDGGHRGVVRVVAGLGAGFEGWRANMLWVGTGFTGFLSEAVIRRDAFCREGHRRRGR